ncbi:transcriptional regulator [Youhaiella tibetensis]|nr:transcriptional regulator [Youhaiella tibetensis]
MQAPQHLDRMFLALADPQRRSMVERLSAGPASVKELAEPLAMALPSALKHLRVLEEGGVVASEKVGRVRTYRMEPGALDPIGAWVKQRENALNRGFDRLAAAMAALPEDEEDQP